MSGEVAPCAARTKIALKSVFTVELPNLTVMVYLPGRGTARPICIASGRRLTATLGRPGGSCGICIWPFISGNIEILASSAIVTLQGYVIPVSLEVYET